MSLERSSRFRLQEFHIVAPKCRYKSDQDISEIHTIREKCFDSRVRLNYSLCKSWHLQRFDHYRLNVYVCLSTFSSVRNCISIHTKNERLPTKHLTNSTVLLWLSSEEFTCRVKRTPVGKWLTLSYPKRLPLAIKFFWL